MPTTHNIPARTERRCEPCEHLKRENMLCSRLHGISCDYVCHHPKFKWRMIGRDSKQPDWCPLKGEPGQRATKTNESHHGFGSSKWLGMITELEIGMAGPVLVLLGAWAGWEWRWRKQIDDAYKHAQRRESYIAQLEHKLDLAEPRWRDHA